jgi:hypothetical protein
MIIALFSSEISCMIIKINDKTTLPDISEAFSDYFTCLQIQFCHIACDQFSKSEEADMVDPKLCIGDLHPKVIIDRLEILPHFRLADVKMEFKEKFGLAARIFTRDKDGWEQTTGMDDFTLSELNQFGRDCSLQTSDPEYTKGIMHLDDKAGEFL